jgi:hypothetical protein
MDDIEHLELTPSLLKFYRSRIHELQKTQHAAILQRLTQVESSAKERAKLEREVLEYEDEVRILSDDLDKAHAGLIRERRAVIELVDENARLRGSSPFYVNVS